MVTVFFNDLSIIKTRPKQTLIFLRPGITVLVQDISKAFIAFY